VNAGAAGGVQGLSGIFVGASIAALKKSAFLVFSVLRAVL